jgi:SAM-dependent methyltransferase
MTEGEFRSRAEHWDNKYSAQDRVWSGQANPVLREVAAWLEQGKALDVGCGEGGDAIWLAERGWTVVGLDLSSVALERAAAAAAERGVGERCTWVTGDVTDGSIASGLGTDGGFDLVTSHYVHEPVDVREAAWVAGANLTAPGGVLLVVGHHPDDEPPPGRGPRDPSVLFTPEEVAEALSAAGGLDVETSEVRERSVVGPDGPTMRRDTVVVARRRS